MAWTNSDYPDAMKNLPRLVRYKAIQIANVLLEEKKLDEGIAIATAISRSKDWAENRGLDFENKGPAKVTDQKVHGEDRYVIPYEGAWGIKTEGKDEVERVFKLKKDAIRHARSETRKNNGMLTIQNRSGKIEKRISYNSRDTRR